MTREDLLKIQSDIDYEFENETLLQQAFIRKSYSEEYKKWQNNEILEFIGDRVLDLIVTKKMYDYYMHFSKKDELVSALQEGQLTNIKKSIVEGKVLAKMIRRLGFQDYLIMGKGDDKNNMQDNESVQEDLFEAILGAVAIDCEWDLETIENVIDVMHDIEYYFEAEIYGDEDYVALVQAWSQKNAGVLPEYQYRESYQAEFVFECRLDIEGIDDEFFTGFGQSKNEARREAAKEAVSYLQDNDLLIDIFDEIGEINVERAINQLQELYQKGYITLPEYNFEQEYDKDGNSIWECLCSLEDENIVFKHMASSKKEAKKLAAFEMLHYIVEQRLLKY